jgi:hypothetical protein
MPSLPSEDGVYLAEKRFGSKGPDKPCVNLTLEPGRVGDGIPFGGDQQDGKPAVRQVVPQTLTKLERLRIARPAMHDDQIISSKLLRSCGFRGMPASREILRLEEGAHVINRGRTLGTK